MESRCLLADPNPKGRGPRLDRGMHVHASRSKPSGTLSLSARAPRTGPGHGLTGCHPADRAGVSLVRLATHDGRAPAEGMGRESHVVIACKGLESVTRTNPWPNRAKGEKRWNNMLVWMYPGRSRGLACRMELATRS